MHLYGLKFLLALISIIGKISYVKSSDKLQSFNQVADFDNIVEKEYDAQMDLERRTLESAAFSATEKHMPISRSLSTLALPLTKSRIRTKSKIHDIKNRESNLFRNDKNFEVNPMSLLDDSIRTEPRLHKKRPKENVFEKPKVYIVNDHTSRTGFFMVREKQPRSSNIKQTDADILEQQHNTKFIELNKKRKLDVDPHDEGTMELQSKNNLNNERKLSHCANCAAVRKLFAIPLLERILLDAINEDNISIVHNNQPLKYVIKEVAPNVPENIFDKPENVRCLRYILKKRRKRSHATYVALRRKAKHHGHLFKRKIEPSDIPSSDQFRNIVAFVVRNKTFDEGFTLVPLVFATVNSKYVSMSNVEASTASSASVASQASPVSMIRSLNNLPVSNHSTITPSNEMLFRVPSLSTPGESSTEVNTNKDILAARSIADELNVKVPRLERTFEDMLKNEQQSRPKKHVVNPTPGQESAVTTSAISSTAPSASSMNTVNPTYVVSTSQSTHNEETNKVSGNPMDDKTADSRNSDMIPGILIYPKQKTKMKRGVEDFSFRDFESNRKLSEMLNTEASLSRESINNKYIDFNPLRKMKKDVSVECKNETDEILDVLNNIAGDNGTAITPISFEGIEDNSSSEKQTEVSNDLYINSTSTTTTSLNISALIPNSEKISELSPYLISTENALLMEKSNTSTINLNSLISQPNSSLNASNLFSDNLTTASGENASAEATKPAIDATELLSVDATQLAAVTGPDVVSLSVASVPNILESSPPPTKAVRRTKDLSKPDKSKEKDTEISTKLKRLESDLKLVNEVQRILNGMSTGNHKIKKRHIDSDCVKGEFGGETTTLLELNLKLVADRSDQISDNKKTDEILALGKFLKWKAKQPKAEYRVRRRARRKKKRKKMKSRKKKKHRKFNRHRRFLGLGTQNFPWTLHKNQSPLISYF